MEVVLAVVIGAWSWVSETFTSFVENHPFVCLFIGVMYGLYQLEQSIHRRLDRIDRNIAGLYER